MAAANWPERADYFLFDGDNGKKKIEYDADTKVAIGQYKSQFNAETQFTE